MPEERKLVTVVFADVVGSTAFGSSHDPGVVRAAMGSYFQRMKGIAETYGGTVEKFIGDDPPTGGATVPPCGSATLVDLQVIEW